MKLIKFENILIVLVSLFCTNITSCDDFPQDPDVELSGDISELVPSYSVYLMCQYSLGNHSINLEAEPLVFLDMDLWKLKVNKVDYYIDDVFQETKTTSPYTFTYESTDWTTGAHTVKANLTISGKDIDTFVFTCTKVIDNSSGSDKAADIYWDYNFVTTGDEFRLELCFNPERSFPGTKIISAKASWDGTSIGEKTSSPFVFTKTISEKPGTVHNISSSAVYIQGKENLTNQFSFPSYEICDTKSARYSYSICSRYRDYKNGEKLRGKARLFKGKDAIYNYGFELYLDGNQIAQTKEFPYIHEYLLTNLSVGEHTLKEVWITYDENWNKKWKPPRQRQ